MPSNAWNAGNIAQEDDYSLLDQQRVQQFLDRHAEGSGCSVQDIATEVRRRTVYEVWPCSDGQMLMLIRLSNRVLRREEMFMGNVLFNDWLNKTFARSIVEAGLGEIEPIVNDLEDACFLIKTNQSHEVLATSFRDALEAGLPDLFFSVDAGEKGLHGTFTDMFAFLKSDFEPFPVYAVPRFLGSELERHVRQQLARLIEQEYLREDKAGTRAPTQSFRTLQATMAFFYGRTSGGTGDVQSHPTFMMRLCFEYGLITPEELCAAFRLDTSVCPDSSTGIDSDGRKGCKDAIMASISEGRFDESKLRHLLRRLHQIFATAIDKEVGEGQVVSDVAVSGQTHLDSWLLPFLRKDGKLIRLDRDQYVASLLHNVTLGPTTLALVQVQQKEQLCRLCGDQAATVPEKNILLGISVGKFYNQLPNQEVQSGQRLCPRCALYSYLLNKLFGSGTVGKFPVPKQDNLIFHYGAHSTESLRNLEERLQLLLGALQRLRELRLDLLNATAAGADSGGRTPLSADDEIAFVFKDLEARQAHGEPITEDDVATVLARVRELRTEKPDVGDILERAAASRVVDLGIGGKRLIAIALPKLKDEQDVAQHRFVRSRLTVFALMAFLQKMCGCNGPYYFQSLPRIDTDVDRIQPDYFYVQDRPISGREYRRRYEMASAFARKVTKERGEKGLKAWLGLSERLAEQPLETFSAVLRDSPIRGADKLGDTRYAVLTNDEGRVIYDRDTSIRNGWEYLTAYAAMHELQDEA